MTREYYPGNYILVDRIYFKKRLDISTKRELYKPCIIAVFQ